MRKEEKSVDRRGSRIRYTYGSVPKARKTQEQSKSVSSPNRLITIAPLTLTL